MASIIRKQTARTVLVVSDDLLILVLAQAVLTSKGYRVLVANDARSAVRVLRRRRVHSVAIRAGMREHQKVRDWSQRKRVHSWTFHGVAEEGRVLLKGLESGADWDSPAAGLTDPA